MCADPVQQFLTAAQRRFRNANPDAIGTNFTDPDGRAGIPFLQDFMKSNLGQAVAGIAAIASYAVGMGGVTSGISMLGAIGGTIGNIVSGAVSIAAIASSVKSVASLANQGSDVARGGSFAMSNELMDDVNSHGHVGMSFSGARNESGVDGDPKKKQSSDLLYKPVSLPSDKLYTTPEMELHLLYSNLCKDPLPEAPESAFKLYREGLVNLEQLFGRWDQAFDDAEIGRAPLTIFVEMLPPLSLYMSYTGRDLNNNPLSTTGRCFAAAGGLLGIGELNVGLNAVRTSTTALTKFYPANNGFLGAAERIFLMPGEQISRYGSGAGRYFSPACTPLSMRALPPGINTNIFNSYKVLKPFEVQAGKIAPAFGQIGLGTQYLSPVSIDVLLKRGIIGR